MEYTPLCKKKNNKFSGKWIKQKNIKLSGETRALKTKCHMFIIIYVLSVILTQFSF